MTDHWQKARRGLKRVQGVAPRVIRQCDIAGQDAMGALRFPGSRSAPALWARVRMSAWTTDTPTDEEASEADRMLAVCTQQMKLRPPNAVISVLARKPPQGEEVSATAREATTIPALDDLRKAAERMGAWVITRGLVGPAVDAVGRIMQGSSAPCIGVCPWVAVSDHQALATNSGKVHHYPVGANHTFLRSSAAAHEEALDSSHTHFLMLDLAGAAERRATGERGVELRGALHTRTRTRTRARIPFPVPALCVLVCTLVPAASPPHRCAPSSLAPYAFFSSSSAARIALESYLCEADLTGNGVATPLLVVVLGGDEHTLRCVRAYLRRRHPVVVLVDTGGAARDIHRYLSGKGLPTAAARGATYAGVAEALLPEIAELGQRTGFTQAPLLTFYRGDGIDAGVSVAPAEPATDGSMAAGALEMALLQGAINNCKTRTDQLRFTVSIAEPNLLTYLLEQVRTAACTREREGSHPLCLTSPPLPHILSLPLLLHPP